MIGVEQPPHEQGREYDRVARASLRALDCEGSDPVAVLIDEDAAGVERVELRREDVWVIRRNSDEVIRWTRPDNQRLVSGVPDWGYMVLDELGLAGEVM